MEDSKNLTKQLNELSEITQWFENQEEIDVEEGLNKVKDAVSLIKASKARLSEIENEFKTIEKDIKVEENK
jgi:exonuclease VII small subunit